MKWGAVAEWFVAVGTLALAVLAVFQDRIRSWLDHPALDISITKAPPDCGSIPFHNQATGQLVIDSFHVRFRVINKGRSRAKQVEVYAEELQRWENGQWRKRDNFPSMNLVWADVGGIYFPGISHGMEKHCNLGRIVDPGGRRQHLPEDENPALALGADQASFKFLLVVDPFHRHHVIPPGRYRVILVVAGENAAPVTKTIELEFNGSWYPDEARMLRDGLDVRIL